MTSSVFTDPSPQYRTATGDVCAGGTLKFFASETLNAQDVYSDSALSTNIGAVVSLGSDGRAEGSSGTITVYLDDSLQYRAQLYDANGALQWDADPINPQATGGSTIPALVSGYFLSNDGSQLLWDLIRQLPDPTGQANKVLSTDGTNFTWISKPADGGSGSNGTNANVTVTPTSVKWNNGTGDLFFIQGGSDSAPASGGHTTQKAVTFATPFKALIGAFPVITSNSFASAGYDAAVSAVNQTTTGFTFQCNTNSSDGSNGNIISSVPFSWIAFGTIAA